MNKWECYASFNTGKNYEKGHHYNWWKTNFWMMSDMSKPVSASYGFWYTSLRYNYRRDYLAPTGGGAFNLNWRLNPALSLQLGVGNTTEFKPDGSVKKVNWIFHIHG